MNEEQKNIETCLAEDVLSEVANVPTDPQFVSLTDEALDPLKQQALQQAGYDGYKEVVMYHQPYTFTPQVKQMKSNLILLLRRLWRFPFGRGTTASSDAGSASAGSAAGSSAASAAAPIRSLADMWQHYITRLKGNPEYGIPSRLSSLTDLPSAPALLVDRKISGVPEAADGMSLVHLICSDERLAITKLQDDNYGYENNSPIYLTPFPNVNELTIGAERIDYGNPQNILTSKSVKTLHIAAKYARASFNIPADGTLDAPNLEKFFVGYGGGPNCETIYMPKFRDPNGTNIFRWWQTDSPLNMKIMILGSVESGSINNWLSGTADRLIHFEFGADGLGGLKISMNLSWWTATNCLDASRTDLIEEGSTATNNLQQFLSNFKTYIAERLTDKGAGLTLTLSQEVRNAIHAAEDEYGIENIIITKKGWTISPAPN